MVGSHLLFNSPTHPPTPPPTGLILLTYLSGTVLLKNDMVPGTSTPLLPLDKSALSKVCITGPLADSAEHMMGNYYGKWDAEAALTPRKAIKEELGELKNLKP